MTTYLDVKERALSPMEQTICVADEICSLNFVMHCELAGELTEESLCAALGKVQARHPLLRMRLQEGRGIPWFRLGAGPIPMRIINGPLPSVVTEAEYELHTGFDRALGPMVRCVWIRHDPGQSTLLTTFHHLIGDGISGSLLLRDLMQALGGADLDVLPLAESMDGHVPSSARGLRGFAGLMKLAGRRLARTLRHGPLRFLPVERPASFGERRAVVRLLRFEPDFVSALAERARKENTTLHGALGAAIVMASYPEIGMSPAHIAFSSALNMRDRFAPPVGDDLGLYATLAYSTHLVGDETAFWPLARELKQGLNEAIAIGQPFYGLTGIAPWIMYRYRKAGGGAAGRATAAKVISRGMINAFALTNIGKVSMAADSGPLRVASLGFVVSLSVLGACAFTASTIDGMLCLNSIVMEPVVSRDTQNRVVERVQSIIYSAVH
ncbi:MAG: condensation domain-containing protein [Pseudomonadota bacterium]